MIPSLDDAASQRFALLDLDRTPRAVAPDSVADERPIEVDDATRSALPEGAAGFDGLPTVVDQGQKALATAEAGEVARFLGTTVNLLEETYYASGTQLIERGRETLRAARAEFEAMPTVAVALGGLVDTIKAERRRDVTMPIAEVSIDADGILRRAGAPAGLVLDEVAWPQLVAKAPDWMPGRMRGNVNAWSKSSGKVVTFRTRRPDTKRGLREAFAVVSPRYQSYDADRIAADIIATAPAGSRAEVVYDGRRMRASVILENPMNIDEAGVGRLHRLMVCLSTSDDGTGSYRCNYKAIRIRCLNATTVSDQALVVAKAHNSSDFVAAVRASIDGGMAAMERFASVWSVAAAQQYHDAYDGTPLAALECFRRLVHGGHVTAPNLDSDALVGHLMACWEKEPGDTVACVNMAITRLHEREVLSPWALDTVEDEAGALLFQNVYQLEGISDEDRTDLGW